MTTPLGGKLAPIPIVDIRDGGPLRHATESRVRARALRDECVRWLPLLAASLLPVIDAVTCRWLTRSCSSYANEVKAITAELNFSGIWFLNGSYQWGCTALAREKTARPGWYERLIGHFRVSAVMWR